MRLPLALLVLLALNSASPRCDALDLRGVRIVDLTHAFNAKTLYWPTSPSGFELKQLAHGNTEAGFFYASNAFCAPEHGGTHLDAPIHFAEGKRTADQVPLEDLVGRSGRTPQDVLAVLCTLEIAGVVEQQPGRRFRRL